MDSLYKTANKHDSCLRGTLIWNLMEDCLLLARARLNPDMYLSFGEHLQKALDDAMYDILTSPTSTCVFDVSDKQCLRLDHFEFDEFFDDESFAIGKKSGRWKQALQCMEVNTKELIQMALASRASRASGKMTLVDVSRRLKTNHVTFLVLEHRDHPDAKAFVAKHSRKRDSKKLKLKLRNNNAKKKHKLKVQKSGGNKRASQIMKSHLISPVYRFELCVHQCEKIISADSNGFSDPYIIAECLNHTQKSQVIKKTLSPKFNWVGRWRIREGYFDTTGKPLVVNLTLKDWNLIMGHKTIGTLHLRFTPGESLEETWKRWKMPDGKEDSRGIYGRIQLSAKFVPVLE